MIKQLAIAATLALATVAPAMAGVNWDHINNAVDQQQAISMNAYNQNDFKTMCHAEANLIHIDNVSRQAAPGSAALTANFRDQTERNLATCRRQGLSTAQTITYTAQYDTPSTGMTFAEAVTLVQGGVSGPESLELDSKCRSKFGGGAYYDPANSVPSRGNYVCRNGSAGRAGTL